jgi:hypothetical protein
MVYDGPELVGVLAHHVKRSPTGFGWGYRGSGPAELARCLLIAHLGERAWCRGCGGSGRQVWSDTEDRFVPAAGAADVADGETSNCLDCWGERTAFGPSLYQRFKEEIVARLPQDEGWTIEGDDIEAWLSARGWATAGGGNGGSDSNEGDLP